MNVPLGCDIRGCVESSLATSCQAFEPNSWMACANIRRSTLERLDASSSGVAVVFRERAPEAIGVYVCATQDGEDACIEQGGDGGDDELDASTGANAVVASNAHCPRRSPPERDPCGGVTAT